MIDVTFTLDSTSWAGKLSTYSVTHEKEYVDELTALDGTEYFGFHVRPYVTFSFMPLTDAETKSLYDSLKDGVVSVSYTDPYLNTVSFANMRVTTPLKSIFRLKSIDGNRYYTGVEITLKQKTVL